MCLHHVFMYVVAGTMHGVLIKGGVLISGVVYTSLLAGTMHTD